MVEKNKAFGRSEDVVVCELQGGSALLDLHSSTYFRLNDTASFIWEQLGEGALSADALADKLIEVYEVEKETCLPHITHILDEFHKAKLITAES